MAVCVICTRFEVVTSCLSGKRSKPTELADHVSLSKSGAKVQQKFETEKKVFLFWSFFFFLDYVMCWKTKINSC